MKHTIHCGVRKPDGSWSTWEEEIAELTEEERHTNARLFLQIIVPAVECGLVTAGTAFGILSGNSGTHHSAS